MDKKRLYLDLTEKEFVVIDILLELCSKYSDPKHISMSLEEVEELLEYVRGEICDQIYNSVEETIFEETKHEISRKKPEVEISKIEKPKDEFVIY